MAPFVPSKVQCHVTGEAEVRLGNEDRKEVYCGVFDALKAKSEFTRICNVRE
jgi:hypothetical protein